MMSFPAPATQRCLPPQAKPQQKCWACLTNIPSRGLNLLFPVDCNTQIICHPLHRVIEHASHVNCLVTPYVYVNVPFFCRPCGLFYSMNNQKTL